MLIISTVFGSKMSFYTKTKNEDWGSGSDVALEMMGKRDREPEGVTTQNLTKTKCFNLGSLFSVIMLHLHLHVYKTNTKPSA